MDMDMDASMAPKRTLLAPDVDIGVLSATSEGELISSSASTTATSTPVLQPTTLAEEPLGAAPITANTSTASELELEAIAALNAMRTSPPDALYGPMGVTSGSYRGGMHHRAFTAPQQHHRYRAMGSDGYSGAMRRHTSTSPPPGPYRHVGMNALEEVSPTRMPIATGRSPKAHVVSACYHCKRTHLGCDESRPCQRCINAGRADSCFDVEHKKRGRPKNKSASSVEGYTAVEKKMGAGRKIGAKKSDATAEEMASSVSKLSGSPPKGGMGVGGYPSPPRPSSQHVSPEFPPVGHLSHRASIGALPSAMNLPPSVVSAASFAPMSLSAVASGLVQHTSPHPSYSPLARRMEYPRSSPKKTIPNSVNAETTAMNASKAPITTASLTTPFVYSGTPTTSNPGAMVMPQFAPSLPPPSFLFPGMSTGMIPRSDEKIQLPELRNISPPSVNDSPDAISMSQGAHRFHGHSPVLYATPTVPSAPTSDSEMNTMLPSFKAMMQSVSVPHRRTQDGMSKDVAMDES